MNYKCMSKQPAPLLRSWTTYWVTEKHWGLFVGGSTPPTLVRRRSWLLLRTTSGNSETLLVLGTMTTMWASRLCQWSTWRSACTTWTPSGCYQWDSIRATWISRTRRWSSWNRNWVLFCTWRIWVHIRRTNGRSCWRVDYALNPMNMSLWSRCPNSILYIYIILLR